MSLFRKRVAELRKYKEIRDSGGFNAIPLPFPKFNEFMPGLMRATGYCVTANSSIGKSRWLKYSVPFNLLNFTRKYPDAFKLKVFYFVLEESKEAFIDSMITTQLYRDHKIEMDTRDLRSMRVGRPTPDDKLFRLIDQYEPLVDSFFQKVDMYDGNVKPSTIKWILEKHALKNGMYLRREFKDDDGTVRSKIVGYQPHDPDEFVLVIIDPINLISTEKDAPTKKQAIDAVTSNIMIHYRDHCKYSFMIVQQQGADSEEQQYTSGRGDLVIPKLLPTLQNLGDSKTTARDFDIVVGLFSPDRYGIGEYKGYDLSRQTSSGVRMGKYYRQMLLLKDRDGIADITVNLYFNGLTNTWSELPPVPTDQVYSQLHQQFNKPYNL